MIDDPTLPLDGTKIVIPSGALNSNQTIKIEQAPNSVVFSEDSNAIIVSFKPEGLTFSKPVTATIPFHGVDINKAKVYYWDIIAERIIQMPIVERNSSNNTVIFNVRKNLFPLFRNNISEYSHGFLKYL